MPPQLREQVERVFQAALAEAPEARAAFVAQACDGNPIVRSEVESLLAFASASGVAVRPSTARRRRLRRRQRSSDAVVVNWAQERRRVVARD